MTDRDSPADFSGFRASFLVEAEEHLQVVEHLTLELESDLGRGATDVPRLRELFRAAHTLKALAAMLEFEPIVEVCHRLESLLRGIERRTLPFSSAVVDLLVDAARALSTLVEDVRSDRPLTHPSALVQRMDDVLSLGAPRSEASPESSAGLGEYEERRMAEAEAAGRRVYEVRFEPTPELAARGVTINAVREQLARLGQIVKVRPEVPSDGRDGIAFVVVLITDADAGAVAAACGLGPESVRPHRPTRMVVEAPSPPDATGRTSVVRVDTARLDELMLLVGELVTSRARIERAAALLDASSGREAALSLQEASQQMERHLRDLRQAVMRIRMVPIREAFGRMPLVVRDTARAAGKQARLELAGEETEVDKVLVDRMIEPLTHLVRNAVDHGLEPAAVRLQNGKPEVGVVRLSAYREGDQVILEVSDDGQGIDREQVAARAGDLGFAPRDVRGSDDALLQALCHPGLSTREAPGRTSGRGVGMDVVQQRVRELGGNLELATRSGRGSAFRVRLPLTLAVAQVLTLSCGGQRFAVPVMAVDEVAEIDRAAIVGFEGQEIVQHRGEVLPLLRLCEVFRLGEGSTDRPYVHALIVSPGTSRWAIAVDRLIGEQEVVIKSVADALVRTPGVVGATDLGDGVLVLVLDVGEVVRMERDRRSAAAARREEA